MYVSVTSHLSQVSGKDLSWSRFTQIRLMTGSTWFGELVSA